MAAEGLSPELLNDPAVLSVAAFDEITLRSARLWQYQADVVPGVLQTRNYAEVLFDDAPRPYPTELRQHLWEARLERLRAVVAGSGRLCMHEMIAVPGRGMSPRLIRETLAHAADIADQFPRLDIRVVTQDALEPYPDIADKGSFVVAQLHENKAGVAPWFAWTGNDADYPLPSIQIADMMPDVNRLFDEIAMSRGDSVDWMRAA